MGTKQKNEQLQQPTEKIGQLEENSSNNDQASNSEANEKELNSQTQSTEKAFFPVGTLTESFSEETEMTKSLRQKASEMEVTIR